MRFLLPVLLLCALAAGQPVPESFILDTTAVWWPVDSIEEMPAVTACGDNFLVVWQTRLGTDWNLMAARIARSGDVLDPSGFAVTSCSLDRRRPRVAGNAEACLVAWEDRRSGVRWDIYGARVNAEGEVLDPAGILVHSGDSDARNATVAFGHGRWLVAWEEGSGNSDIYAALVDASGTVGPTIPVCRANGTQAYPAATATDSGFVVVWEDWRNGSYPQVRFARLTPDGTIRTADIALWPDRYDQERPAVARLGSNTLVAWEASALLDSEVWGVRLAPNGAVLDSAVIRIAAAPGPQRRPQLTTLGDDALAVWVDSRNPATVTDIYAARILPDGSVANPDGVPVAVAAGTQDQPCIAGADTLVLVAWRDIPGDTVYSDIRAARVSARDSVLDPNGFSVVDRVVPVYYTQRDPVIAEGGGQYLVAWTDYRARTTGLDIYGMRVSHGGTVLDPVPFVICSAPGDQSTPQVAFNGTHYLVVWLDSRSASQALYGARIDTLGRVVDAVNLVLSYATCNEPAVTSDGARWLVVWCSQQRDVFGTFVEDDGYITHPGGFRLTESAYYKYDPAVVFGAEQYLVAWHVSRPLYTIEIAGNRIARDGTLLDTAKYYSHLVGADRNPALAFDGEVFFAAWTYGQGSLRAICCLRVDETGVARDSPPVFVQQSSNYYDGIALVFNGTHHYLAWSEQVGTSWLLRGARVGRSTAVFDTFLLVTASRERPVPALASSPAGEMLTVYAGWVDSINGRPAGVARIKGVLSPYGGVTEDRDAGTLRPALRATPVPFRREVRLELTAGTGDTVIIRDAAGRRVRALKPGPDGLVTWDGADRLGRQVPRGVYFAGLRSAPGQPPCKLVKLE